MFAALPYENKRLFDTYVHIQYEHPRPSGCASFCTTTVCVSVVIAALFIILAAHQVLPQGINAISFLGIWGYALGGGFLGISVLALVCLKLKLCLGQEANARNSQTPYKNTTSLALAPLSDYPNHELFVTEDGYCFVVEEQAELLKNQFCFYNPYTQVKLSDADVNRLLENPVIKTCWERLTQQQRENASKFSEATINALKALAEGCLNVNEILQMSHTPVPIAQQFLDQFTSYYNDLEEEERGALNDYWIPQSPRSGTATLKFGDLYSSLDQICVHGIGSQLVLMVWQLNPHVTFNVEGFFASSEILQLREHYERYLRT